MGAGAVCLLTPALGWAAANARPVRLLVLDNDTPGARTSFKSFLQALDRRFGNSPTRFETLFVPLSTDTRNNYALLIPKAATPFRPDIIFASNQEQALACAALKMGKPIIFYSSVDPIAGQLTESLTRPSKGMTGFVLGTRVAVKRREMLLRLAPHCKRMGLLTSSDLLSEGQARTSGSMQDAVAGVTQQRFECDSVAQLEALMKSAAGRAVDAWDVEYTMVPYQYAEETVRCFNQLKRPVIYPRMKHIQMGGMAAYAPKIEEADDVWVSQLASLLAGVPIENIPIVQSTRYSFGLNLKACHRAGVVPSKALIRIADVVIE